MAGDARLRPGGGVAWVGARGVGVGEYLDGYRLDDHSGDGDPCLDNLII